MKKYETIISIRETKTVRLTSESREDVVNRLKQEYPGWSFDIITEIVEEETRDGDEDYINHEIFGYCESSGRPIFFGDEYYQWCGEDWILTHKDVGGADENHKLSIAE